MKSKVFRSMICLFLSLLLVFGSCAYAGVDVKILSVKVDGARVRNANGEIIGHANKGLKVFYMGKHIRSNSLVRCANGKEGYIYDGFLELYGTTSSDNIYYCNKNSSRIYRSASTNSGRLGYMYKNQYVILARVQGDWAYVRNMNGSGGFCKLADISKAQ